MKRLIVITVLAAMLTALIQIPAAAADDRFDTVRLKWFDYLAASGSGESYVRDRINALNSSAYYHWLNMNKAEDRTYLFASLQATDKSAQMTQGYNLLGIMAQAYSISGGFLYKNEQMKNDLIEALDWMHDNRYNTGIREFDNWWDWEIGTPSKLNDIIVLLYDQLGAERIKRYTGVIRYFVPDPKVCAQQMYPFESTAANRVSMCKVAALSGILEKDASRVAEASSALEPVFEYVTEGDGFYRDGSFIQHGKFAYTGGYGMGLMSGLGEMIYMLGGSGWAVPAQDILFDWFYDSFIPFTYEGLMMDCVTGRNASRDYNQTYCAAALFDIVVMLSEIAPAQKRDGLREIAATWLEQDRLGVIYSQAGMFALSKISGLLGVQTQARVGSHKQFPAMDRVVHHREDYAFAISMSSERTYNYESILNENLRGWHSADGMTYLYDEDYAHYTDGFWATVDAARLPGTTVEQRPRANAENASKPGGGAQVGGVSLDSFGAACMELAPAGSGLLAKKAWFMFDDEIVALGADIKDNSGNMVETVIDNRMTTDEQVFSQGESWAHISGKDNAAGIGYYIPVKRGMKAVREKRSGAWSDINAACSQTVLNREYVTMWFEHGNNPVNGSYTYALLPGKTQEQTEQYAQAPAFEILENSAYAQAAVQKELGVKGVVFWKDEEYTVSDITCSGKACVMTRESDGQLTVGISDPTQKQTGRIIVELDKTAADIISCDDRIEVVSTYPKLKLAFDADGSSGVSATVVFGKCRQPWKTAASFDNAIKTEMQNNGGVIISDNGSLTFRRWADGTSVYGDGKTAEGYDTLCIRQTRAAEYKDHILIPKDVVMRGGTTKLEFDTEMVCADGESAAYMMLKLNNAIGFLPLTGNLIGLGRQKITVVIDLENLLVYSRVNGKTVKSAEMAKVPSEADLSDLRLYTSVKPVQGSFTDGTQQLSSEVEWRIGSITVSHASNSELVYIKECGASDGRIGAVIANDTPFAVGAEVYFAEYRNGEFAGISAKENVSLQSGEEYLAGAEQGKAEECIVYLWDINMHPYDIHRVKYPQ